jgi:hypothetical protein
MRSLVLLACAATPLASAPAVAQGGSNRTQFSTVSPAAQSEFGNRNFSFRLNEIIGQDGSRQKRRSIIAGVDVGPGTTVGFGLFDSGPKAKGRGPDPRLDGLSKRSRKAAVGMSFRF